MDNKISEDSDDILDDESGELEQNELLKKDHIKTKLSRASVLNKDKEYSREDF